MATGFIELNDAGITQSIDGKLLGSSPAYAVLDKHKLLLGEQARQNARLLPRWTNNRFWNQLNRDPIPDSTALYRHHADLAFAHLEQIWQKMRQSSEKDLDQLIVGVPGFYSQEQLGLLLGMARASNIPVTGLIDTSLASIAQEKTQQTILHLDISLHRVLLSHIKSNEMLNKIETHTIVEFGLSTLWDRWANIITEQFIQTSRFDPMHHAISEQALFNILPQWIKETTSASSRQFEMELANINYSAPIASEQLRGPCSSIYAKINQAIQSLVPDNTYSSLFISHRFKGFPGLDDALSTIKNIQIRHLSDTAASEAVYKYWQQIISEADAISHITSLSVEQGKTDTSKLRQAPTHLLYGHQAYKISDHLSITDLSTIGLEHDLDQNFDHDLNHKPQKSAFTLSRHNQELILEVHDPGVRLNDQLIDAKVSLKLGDKITLDNQTVILVAAN